MNTDEKLVLALFKTLTPRQQAETLRLISGRVSISGHGKYDLKRSVQRPVSQGVQKLTLSS